MQEDGFIKDDTHSMYSMSGTSEKSTEVVEVGKCLDFEKFDEFINKK